MDIDRYDKVVFTRSGDAPLPAWQGRELQWKSAADDPQAFRDALSTVVIGSLDGHDAWTTARDGVAATVDSYLDVDESHFIRDPSRWETARDGGPLVGLIQPVLYVQGHRDGRPEGTLNYIGVVPGKRGSGYITELLLRATISLYEQSVWRIFCDTDVRNFPMIAAFERLGYERGKVRSVPLGRD